jgi:hypothetical protein
VIERIFDGDAIAAFEQHAHDEIERLLRAIHDDHLRRLAGHRAGTAQMGADRFTQRGAAGRGAVVELGYRGFARAAKQDAPPHLEGEGLDIALAAAEGEVIMMHAGLSALKIQRRRALCCRRAEAR